ncbi:MAG: trigger factor [Chitinivibrionales bacterium]|nr:trigger factor [Chitinivibrionales bacterium]
MLKAKYGEAIRAEVIDNLIQRSYEEACRDHEIVPVSQAKVNKLAADEGSPIAFSIETEVDPEFTLKGYDKVKIKPSPKKIKKSDVDEAVANLRERLAEFRDVDRKAKKGDFVTIDYERVEIDGEEKPEVTSPQHPVEIGASQIKDFDKGLIGLAAGDVADITVRFPSGYGDSELAGKTGKLSVKVRKVQERILPEINEEFFKKIGDFSDEDALREEIRKDIQNRENERARNDACNKAIETLIDKNPFDVPPARIQQYIDHVLEQLQRQAGENNPVPSRNEIEDRYREMAVKTIKRYRIIDYIANEQKIKATQEEVDAEIRKIADQYGQPFETVKQALRRNGTTNRIRNDIRERKTLNTLIKDADQEA